MDSRVIYVCPDYQEYEQDFKTKRIWRTDRKYEPFVYIIQEVETGMMYIGSRTKSKCLESDLGTKYFTSSKEFDWKLNPESFKILEIILCASNHDALILEGILIKDYDAVKSHSYYNLYHPHVGWNTSGKELTDKQKKNLKMPKTEEHKRKIGESNRKPKKHLYPKNFCEKMKELMKRTHGGVPKTEEHKRKIGDAHRGSKRSKKAKQNMSDKHYAKDPIKKKAVYSKVSATKTKNHPIFNESKEIKELLVYYVEENNPITAHSLYKYYVNDINGKANVTSSSFKSVLKAIIENRFL